MDNQISKQEALILLSSNDVITATNTLLYICFNFEDWRWVQDECIKLINNTNGDIKGLAINCLGHIARIHSEIDKEKVLSVLMTEIKNDKEFAGRAQDALDDIEMFAK